MVLISCFANLRGSSLGVVVFYAMKPHLVDRGPEARGVAYIAGLLAPHAEPIEEMGREKEALYGG